MANVALSHGHRQLRLLSFSVVLVAVAAVVLALEGATNQVALTVLPGIAGMTGFGIEEYSLHRVDHGRRPLHHLLRAGFVGAAVFIGAVAVFCGT